MPELVSILIPTYNAEKWIGNTIKSAIAQDWPKKEIIIVNDGSTDNTVSVAKTFESELLKVVTQDNCGASAARNKALSLAQGDYIQWLDADDMLAPDKISQQLKGSGPDSSSRTLLTSAWGKFFFCPQRAKFRPDALWQDLVPLDWILKKFTENLWMNPAVWLVSRQLTELAGPWDERLSLDDDGEYMCRLVASSTNVKFVPRAHCYYRVGNIGSVSTNRSDEALASLYLSTFLCIEHLLSLEDTGKTRAACVEYLQQLFHCFFPEQVEIVNKACGLAQRLGGELVLPSENLKFCLVRKLVGRQHAKHIKFRFDEAKLFALKSWDKFVCNFYTA